MMRDDPQLPGTEWRTAGNQWLRPVSGSAPPLDSERYRIRYLELLWRRKWLILGLVMLGALGGFGWVIFNPPTYTASAVIELLGINESFLGMNQVDPQAGTGNYGTTAANIQTQTRILMGNALRSRVMERVNLEMTPINSTPQDLFSKLRNRFKVLPQEPVELMREAIKHAALSTRARGVGASRLIQISCESISPEVAAGYINALANEYVSQNAQIRSNAALRTTQWMEGQVEETRNRVEQAEKKLQGFMRSAGSAFVLDQGTLDESKLRQLQAELSASQAERITKQSRWELAKSSPVDSLPEVLDDGRLRELKNRITDLRRERAQLTATLTPQHYKVQRIDAQINELEQTLQQEKRNLVQRIQNEYESALRREKLLYNAYRGQSGTLVNQADKAAEYLTLKREAEMARQVYNTLLQQLNQAAVIAALPTNHARVVETAGVNAVAVRPKPLRDISLGGALGGLLAAGGFILFEMLRLKRLAKVFVAPGDTSELLHVPELSVIPAIEIELRRPLLRLAKGSRPAALLPKLETSQELKAWNEGPSFFTESFRFALASLLSGKQTLRHAAVLVTSPGAGEGKTTFTSNLAMAAARVGRKVLLIDADLQRARLHKVFKTPLEPGLRDLLTSEDPISSLDLAGYFRPTEIAGLTLLPAGSSEPSDSSGLFFSGRLHELMHLLKKQFDLVLIDTAPALYFSDSRLLGRLADGVILVVRSGKTNQESALAVTRRFQYDGVPVLGTVLNDWDPGDSHYGSDYSYYYSRYSRLYGDEGKAK